MLDVRLPDYPFALSFYVWFRDLDAMGHVNNSVYFTYFEQVRTRYWLSLHSETDFMHLGFIVVHAECDYVSPASLGQSLLAGCKVTEIHRSSFVFDYRIVSGEKAGPDAEARVVATGKTVQALYDWNAKKTIPFNEALKKKIEAREGRAFKTTG